MRNSKYNKYYDETPPLCACGCGKFVQLNIRENGWNQYIYQHQSNILEHTQITKDKISKAVKQRYEENHIPIDGKYLCLKCKEYKEEDAFNSSKSAGYRNYNHIWCKKCLSEYNSTYRNKQKIKSITTLEDMMKYIDTKININWDMISKSVLDALGIVKFMEFINNGKEINKISTHKIYNS